jgi:endonuclease/exonuclease/phosphatase family metal-dependent hydrolase
MRVVVHNVKGFRRARPKRMAETMRGFSPDLILITECGTRRKLRRYAKALGMIAHHGSLPPFLRRARNGVVVAEGFDVVRSGMQVFAGSARLHPRGAFFAEVVGPEGRFWAVSVHLGLKGEERGRHVEEMMRLLEHVEPPLLVGGDLNARPDSRVVARLAEIGWDSWARMGQSTGETYPSDDPVARIDYLFVSRGVVVEGAMVPGGAMVREASDHLPVVVDLRLARRS